MYARVNFRHIINVNFTEKYFQIASKCFIFCVNFYVIFVLFSHIFVLNQHKNLRDLFGTREMC